MPACGVTVMAATQGDHNPAGDDQLPSQQQQQQQQRNEGQAHAVPAIEIDHLQPAAGSQSQGHLDVASAAPFKRRASIHRVRDIQPQNLTVENDYDIVKEIGAGDYGKVLLAKHKVTGREVALKAIPRAATPLRDFLTEFHYSYFLSPHPNILDTYDVCFETDEHYFFAQEVAPLGDLWHWIEAANGLDEQDLKEVLRQVVAALEFMHSKELVHRDVRAENILVFKSDFSKVKLTDFGLTRRAGTLVKKRTRSLPTCPPEIWEMLSMEGYTVETGSDGWQVGMLVYVGLTARFPWEKADITDPRFTEFIEWQKRKTTRTPKEFKRFSPRLLRMFRRLLEQKPKNRYEVSEVHKYYDDRWLVSRSPRTSKVAEMHDSGMQTAAATLASGGHLLPPPSCGGDLLVPGGSGGGTGSRKNSWAGSAGGGSVASGTKSRDATPSPVNH